MNNREKRKGRTPSALDVFVVLIVLACLAALALRLTVGREGVLPKGVPEKATYSVSFEIAGQRDTAGSEISTGDIFYTEDGTLFGTLSGSVSRIPARRYTVAEDGTLVMSRSPEGDGARSDVTGTLAVEGYPVEYGFLAAGTTYIAPNCRISLHTENMTVTARITGIEKIGE